MARNTKGKIVGRKRGLSTRIKRKQCYRKKKKVYLIIFWRTIDMAPHMSAVHPHLD
jgi:hypothetical protein